MITASVLKGLINTGLILKKSLLERKKNHIKISEMSSSVGAMFVEVQANFPDTFVSFRFMIIAQERISTYDDHVRKVFNSYASFKILLSM